MPAGQQPCEYCGWVNIWTDSGDRGLAEVDHQKECTGAKQSNNQFDREDNDA